MSCANYQAAEVEARVASGDTACVVRLRGVGELQGTIRNERGDAVAGARVEIQGGVVTAGANGAFALQGLDCLPAQTVRISAPGFRPMSASIQVAGSTTRDFVLERRADMRVNLVLKGLSEPLNQSVQHKVVFPAEGANPQARIVTFEDSQGRCVIDDTGLDEITASLSAGGGSVSARGAVRRGDRGSTATLEFDRVRAIAIRLHDARGAAVEEPEAFLRLGEEVYTLRLRGGSGSLLVAQLAQSADAVFWSVSGVSTPTDLASSTVGHGTFDVSLGDHGGRIVIAQRGLDSREAFPVGRLGEHGFHVVSRESDGKQFRTFWVPPGGYSILLEMGVATGQELEVAAGETVECDLSADAISVGFEVRSPCLARLSRVTPGRRPEVVEELDAVPGSSRTIRDLGKGDYVITLFGTANCYAVYPVALWQSGHHDMGVLDAPTAETRKFRLIDPAGRVVAKPSLSWTIIPKSIHPKQHLIPGTDGSFTIPRPADCALAHVSSPQWFGQVALVDIGGLFMDLPGPQETADQWVRLPGEVGEIRQALEIQSRGGNLWFVERKMKAGRVQVSSGCFGLLILGNKMGTQLLSTRAEDALLGDAIKVHTDEDRVFLEEVFGVRCPGLRVNVSVFDDEDSRVIYLPAGCRRVP